MTPPDQSSLDERKIKILEAVEVFADVVRGDAVFSERHKARQAFRAALDEALVDPEVERLRAALREIHLIARAQVTQYATARKQVERIARDALAPNEGEKP